MTAKPHFAAVRKDIWDDWVKLGGTGQFEPIKKLIAEDQSGRKWKYP